MKLDPDQARARCNAASHHLPGCCGHARDEYHRHSKFSFVATGVICGLGPFGYIAALHAIANMR
ncbi:type II 3-dehydroquinate dehydratase [Bradyrhizobium sp. USDA 4486]